MNWMYRLLTVVELIYIFRAIKKRKEEKPICKNCGCPIDETVETPSTMYYEPIHQKPNSGPHTN